MIYPDNGNARHKAHSVVVWNLSRGSWEASYRLQRQKISILGVWAVLWLSHWS